ncbi:Killing trait domain-containing protein [Nannocystis exedens]|uniref:Killing trait domain-containing protein n=1 Tax=Nannocystis exedens TaxID=54 RepID=A0A1I2D5K0_9BACT|nr:RebB family R body protein [Nannocystis exedens]PCC70719.1 Killing trait [Nannocystis exedens]SFE75806.1 Killing trait domain-containing protein [Nannocystis exedens]
MTANDEAEAFARTASAVTQAVTRALAQLEAVLAAQRRGIVALAAVGGIELPALPAPAPALDDQVPKDMSEGTPASEAQDDPAGLARAALYQVAAHAIGMALHNAVTAQQHLNVLGQAVAAQAAARVLAGRGE